MVTDEYIDHKDEVLADSSEAMTKTIVYLTGMKPVSEFVIRSQYDPSMLATNFVLSTTITCPLTPEAFQFRCEHYKRTR